MSDIFVSYTHGDRSFVDRLCADIAKAGVSVWYDTRIAPGSHWDTVIVDNLLHSHGLVALVSRAALRSDWVTFEWALGVRSGKEVLVLMMTRDDVSPSELPEYLRHIQALPVSDSAPNDDIIRAISAMDLPPRLWSEFSDGGVDICLPREKFKKPDDKAVVDIEGVNLRAVNAALSLQQQLLAKVGSLSQAGDPSASSSYQIVGHLCDPTATM